MSYDVVIVGGGPAGLQAALTLARARKRVVVFDGGPRRNAAAERIRNFVTRDGTPPDEFRRLGREQLAAYPDVEVREARVDSIVGTVGEFRVTLGTDSVVARRVLLCTGLIDEMLPVDGFRELWGHSIFQCPYCHGWEARDRAWGFWARPEHAARVLPFAAMLRAWSSDLTVFTDDAFELPDEERSKLERAGVRVETGRVSALVREGAELGALELADGKRVPCRALFVHPPQKQVELVTSLGLALDEEGFVQTDPLRRETSIPGVFAAGDLTTRLQGALLAAAAGTQAATFLNLDLMLEAMN